MRDLANKIKRAASMSKVELASTLGAMASKRARKYWLKIRHIHLSDRQLIKSMGCRSRNDVLNQRLSPFFIEAGDPGKIVQAVKANYPDSIGDTVPDADKICDHIFQFLGSGTSSLGNIIDWHRDFKSGFRWDEKVHYLTSGKYVSCYLDKGIPADVKVPWELSRCQHYATLGKAYWYTADEKYAKEFAGEVESWITANPVELGVNWACTMDVAIRAVNWIWGYYFFCDSKILTDEFKLKLLKSLFLHGRHIRNNLEYGVIRGNHYLSDIVGLVYLGIFFKGSLEGKRWLDKGVSALLEEMKYQVYEDGVDFEGSISYHRLVTELFTSATLLCIKNGTTFPDWYMERLEKMMEFILYYTKPDGMAPQIGDNDDGRLHILSDYGKWDRCDHRYLLSVGAVMFNRPDFKRVAGRFHEESFWLLGPDGLNKYNSLPCSELPIASRSYNKSGFYIMRSGDGYMIIDGSSIDKAAPSGHKHNGRLSFELFCGRSFIVDPGTYMYTADKNMRNLFRSTAYHNTAVIDGEEQNRFDKDDLFLMGHDARVTIRKWDTNEEYDYFDAEQDGYTRLKDPVIHRRIIFFNKENKYWIIRDIFTGNGHHDIDLYFHFVPVELEHQGMAVKVKGMGKKMVLVPLDKAGLKMDILKGDVSYSYGTKVATSILKHSKSGETPIYFTNIIFTYDDDIDIEHILENVKNDLSRVDEALG